MKLKNSSAISQRLNPADSQAIRNGRFETWVVTTRPDGSTIVEVLNALGKTKPVNTSNILKSGINLSGAKL